MDKVDLLIVGAGPAGLQAAKVASASGLSVWLVDENPLPGGQLLRQVTQSPWPEPQTLFGAEYAAQQGLAETAFSGDITYLPQTLVWQITPQKQAFLLQRGEKPRQLRVEARFIILATGAQERCLPIPGWTLPGVMTIGSAQLLMKTAGLLPPQQSVLVGNGPLLLLFAAQVIRAGGKVQAILDTSNLGDYLRAAPRLLSALWHSPSELYKGWQLLREIRRAKIPYFSAVSDLAIDGEKQAEGIRFRHGGKAQQLQSNSVLCHIGVLPEIQLATALGCQLAWDEDQQYWYPQTDAHGESSQAGIYLAGDGAGIVGGEAARLGGHLAAISILHADGRIADDAYYQQVGQLQRQQQRYQPLRAFLSRLYPLPSRRHQPDDKVIICRCEQVTAGTLRQAARAGVKGANQLKAFTRCGMGHCQGRMCSHNAIAILANEQKKTPQQLGYPRARFPIKPLTLEELALSNEPQE
jgi:NADPH-dependent 2,4-dienoyl-CoA reductase/sulfur reductase-like enzyme